MKGAIFTNLQEMVEDSMGFEVWDQLIESCDLPSGGVYTSSKTYDDAEAIALVGALSAHTGAPASELLRSFGKYLFSRLHGSIQHALELPGNLFDYLASVDTIIHVEVKKLDSEAETPELSVISQDENQLSLAYRSPKQLCHLAIGLIEGTAEMFGETVNIDMPVCTEHGGDHCKIVITR